MLKKCRIGGVETTIEILEDSELFLMKLSANEYFVSGFWMRRHAGYTS